MEDNAEIFYLQGDALEPACDPVDGREPGPHTPGHRAELFSIAGVALADNLVEIRRPQNVIFVGELCQPPLGDFEVLPAVEYVEQTVFQLVWVLSHHPVQIDEVAVGVVEDFSHGPLLVEKNGAAAPEHFHIDHVLVAGWEPFDDRGEQGLFPTDPWSMAMPGASSCWGTTRKWSFPIKRERLLPLSQFTRRAGWSSTPTTVPFMPGFKCSSSLQREITSTLVPGGY